MSDSSSTPVRIALSGTTHVGGARRENQDVFLIAWMAESASAVTPDATRDVPPDGVLFLVADGMGGPAGGAQASAVAADTFRGRLTEHLGSGTSNGASVDLDTLLRDAAEAAHEEVRNRANEQPALAGMGTTLTAGLIRNHTLHLVQVGDSRAYLLRDDTLTQLTRDQSIVQEMVDAGVLTPAEARVSPHRNVILQALGADGDMEPVVSRHAVLPGDRILLCTDGLTGEIDAETLADTLAGDATPTELCRLLLEAARVEEANDNVTCVVAELSPG